MTKPTSNRIRPLIAALPAAILLLTLFAGSLASPQKAWSDDRDLLGGSVAKPFVFFILDTSDSMREWPAADPEEWAPMGDDDPDAKFYQAKKAIYEVMKTVGPNALFGFATFDTGGFSAADKHFMYTPQSNPSWFSGAPFASGDPTRPWNGPGTADVAYPRVGHPLVFGRDSAMDEQDPAAQRRGGNYYNDNMDGSCDTPENLDVGTDTYSVGGTDPVYNTDTVALGQLWHFSKLGENGEHDTIQWFKLNGELYRLTWKALTGGQAMGDVPLMVDVILEHEADGSCSCGFGGAASCTGVSFDSTINETLTLVPYKSGDQDGDPFVTAPTEYFDENDGRPAFFPEGGNDYDADGACDTGRWLESNSDGDDPRFSYDVLADPEGLDPINHTLDRGDFVPLDWKNRYSVGNREEIMRRLAPSIVVGEPPDFRSARYYNGTREDQVGGDLLLLPAFANYPPIAIGNSTPLAGSLFRFRQWLDDWQPIAEANDPGWDCRAGIHVILMTDGLETCAGDYLSLPNSEFCPLTDPQVGELTGDQWDCKDNDEENAAYQAQVLRNGLLNGAARDVKTYVLAFDIVNDAMNRTAEGGGTCSDRNGDSIIDPNTECAYFATTKDEMVSALVEIFSDIQGEPRTFVPAATPPRSFDADPKIVLNNFRPIPGSSVWDGHLTAFITPLPLTAEGLPNTGRTCGGIITESCFLWDSGEEMKSQAPTEAQVATDPPTLKLGPGADERRVFYSVEPTDPDALPLPRRFFEWTATTTPEEWNDLLLGMGLVTGPSGVCGDATCDPGETSCSCAADCGAAPGTEVGFCTDVFDNDCDGSADCGDSDCATDPACAFCGDSICGAGEDSCNCAVDCGLPPGTETGLCTDVFDNDCDSFVDCADGDCSGDPACVAAPFCGDGSCDPGEDTCNCSVDCGAPPASETGVCTDGLDNDCDGTSDCADTDCAADPACDPGSCGASGSVVVAVSAATDDAWEDDEGVMDRFGSIDFIGGGSVSWQGFRFRDPGVPDGAIIDSAFVDIAANTGGSDYTKMYIYGEPTGDCPTFSSSRYDITDRTRTSSVLWDPVPTWTWHNVYSTPDLKTIVQEIVDLPAWDEAASDMCFLFRTTLGEREGESVDGDDNLPAILRIDYSCPSAKAAPAALAAAAPAALPPETRAKNAIRHALKIKTAVIPDPATGMDVTIDYVLGDIFHSDPAVLGLPDNGTFFGSDVFGDGTACVDGNPGYRCFFDQHQYRRQVLLTGANDGEVHAFDLATFDYTTDPAEDGKYNSGTGRELFGFIPRQVLPNVLQQAETTDHDWDVDNAIRLADAFIDPVHDGTPTAGDREWRSVAVGGLRRGGRIHFALDLTQPDKLDAKGVGVPINGYVPSCWNEGGTADCGPVAYGTALWEFSDTWDEDPPASPLGSGSPDLGDTWSIVNTGMIRVLFDDGTGVAEVPRFVSVFGGGLDPSKVGNLGNWLYMIDIETGLPIYKRRLSSSAAAEPAAVDTNQDGFLDTIYIGTIDGYLYKADISTPKLLDPTATTTNYSTGSPVVKTVLRVTDAAWEPFAIFDTGGRPIYFPPSVIFVAKQALYSVAFGTGDREDVFLDTSQVGRFYNVLDDDFVTGDPRLPLTEADLEVIPFDTTTQQGSDLLVTPPAGKESGWVLTMTNNERVITKSLAFGGLLIWSTYNPDVSDPSSCVGTGESNVYVVTSTNANPLHEDAVGDETRYFSIPDFLTSPYVEPGGAPPEPSEESDGDICSEMAAVTQKLMQFFPPNCKFTNRTQNVMTQKSRTGLQCIAPVPVCVNPKNWKEF